MSEVGSRYHRNVYAGFSIASTILGVAIHFLPHQKAEDLRTRYVENGIQNQVDQKLKPLFVEAAKQNNGSDQTVNLKLPQSLEIKFNSINKEADADTAIKLENDKVASVAKDILWAIIALGFAYLSKGQHRLLRSPSPAPA